MMDENGTNSTQINPVAAGLSLAILVAMGAIGDVVLLMSVASVLRGHRGRTSRVVHELIVAFGCVELLFVSVPCLMAACAYLLPTWSVADPHQSVCDFVGWVVIALRFGSLWILTVVAFERYLQVVAHRDRRDKAGSVCRGLDRTTSTRGTSSERLRYTAVGGLLVIAVVAAVPLMGDSNHMAPSGLGSSCLFDTTPQSTHSRAFSITVIIFAFAMFQVCIFCHVSLMCISRDLRPRTTSPIQDGDTLESGAKETCRHHHLHYCNVESTFAYTPVTAWVWMCVMPFMVTLIMAQNLSEIGVRTEFAVQRILTICSALSPYILMASCRNYRTALVNATRCVRGGNSFEEQRETHALENGARCSNCYAQISLQEPANCHSYDASTRRGADWSNVPNVNVQITNDGISIAEFDRNHAHHAQTPPNLRELPADSQMFLVTAGKDGELVYQGVMADASQFQNGGRADWSSMTEGTKGDAHHQGVHDTNDGAVNADQSSGYVLAMPVNMPGQGTHETVERIFFIQEPLHHDRELDSKITDCTNHERILQQHDPNTSADIHSIAKEKYITEDANRDCTDDRIKPEEELSSNQDINMPSQPNEPDTEGPARLEDESRPYLGVVEENIRIRGPSASDPRLVTLAFQQAMLVKSHQNSLADDTPNDVIHSGEGNSHSVHSPSPNNNLQTDKLGMTSLEDISSLKSPSSDATPLGTGSISSIERSPAGSGQPTIQIVRLPDPKTISPEYKGSENTTSVNTAPSGAEKASNGLPTINVTPAADDPRDPDDIPSLFPVRERGLDYRFLTPIVEEGGYGLRLFSTKHTHVSSMLTLKHEKVHRLPKTSVQIRAERKLKADMKRNAFSKSSVHADEFNNSMEKESGHIPDEQRSQDSRRQAFAKSSVHANNGEPEPQTLSYDHSEGNDEAHTANKGKPNSGKKVPNPVIGNLAKPSEEGTATETSNEKVSPRTLERVGYVIENSKIMTGRTSDPLLDTPEWSKVEDAMHGRINHGFVVEGESAESVNKFDGRGETLDGPSVQSTNSSENNREENNKGRLVSEKKLNALRRQNNISESFEEVQLRNELKSSSTISKPTAAGELLSRSHSDNSSLDVGKEPNIGIRTDSTSPNNSPIVVESRVRLVPNTSGNKSGGRPNKDLEMLRLQNGKVQAPRLSLSGTNSFPLAQMRAFSVDGSAKGSLFVMYPPNASGMSVSDLKDLNYAGMKGRRLVRMSSLDTIDLKASPPPAASFALQNDKGLNGQAFLGKNMPSTLINAPVRNDTQELKVKMV